MSSPTPLQGAGRPLRAAVRGDHLCLQRVPRTPRFQRFGFGSFLSRYQRAQFFWVKTIEFLQASRSGREFGILGLELLLLVHHLTQQRCFRVGRLFTASRSESNGFSLRSSEVGSSSRSSRSKRRGIIAATTATAFAAFNLLLIPITAALQHLLYVTK